MGRVNRAKTPREKRTFHPSPCLDQERRLSIIASMLEPFHQRYGEELGRMLSATSYPPRYQSKKLEGNVKAFTL
jgi:hypothetical protein